MELYLVLSGHDFFHEVQTMSQVFFPNRKYLRTESLENDGITIHSILQDSESAAIVYNGGNFLCEAKWHIMQEDEKSLKNAVKAAIYKALAPYLQMYPKWGILTGIRPAKLVTELFSSGKSEQEVFRILKETYFVDYKKANLAVTVSKNETEIMEREIPKGMKSLYIGIPFCPTKCLYCSFTSYPIDKYKGTTDEYLNCLKKEMLALPDVELGSIYIGGGTPTSINAEQLEFLLSAIEEKFDTNGIEYTVEAGRPDTITPEKLLVMKKHGVGRLSVNPQTMNDKTLEKIGRSHDAEHIITAFKMAREAGFSNINMDLILGLPDEDMDDVKNTFEIIRSLDPESITVHTLAVKRASRLNEHLSSFELTKAETIESMLEMAAWYAEKMDMLPYYMYRQKNMLGNFENIGYCKKGCHSIYNIITMEETETIYAAGAGAITKIVENGHIKRQFNVKNVEEYIARIKGKQ